MITPELRKRAKEHENVTAYTKDGKVSQAVYANACSVISGLLDVIDANVCKPVCSHQGCYNEATKRVFPCEHFRMPLCVGCLAQYLSAQAMSSRLKTKDGIEIKHGMTIWPQHEIEGEMGAIVRLTLTDNATGDITVHGDTADITKCFASRTPEKSL